MLYKISEQIFKMIQEGHQILKLNMGEPDWPTSTECVEAAIKAIKDGKTKYASAQGEKELREKIAVLHDSSPDNVVLTPGSKYSIYNAMKILLKKGDEVILFSPHWTAFELIAKECGAIPKVIDLSFEKDWNLDFEKIKNTFSSKTKLVIFNNPCNPTSHVWSIKEENKLIEFVKKKGVYILLDCAYRGISFSKMPFVKYDEKVIICDTFSKTFGMTGWRLGYIVAHKNLINEITRLNQISITNVPVFVQAAGIAALDNYSIIAEKTRTESKRRAEACISILKGRIKFNKPMAGFYLFPNLEVDGEKAFDIMLEKHKISIVPGAAFGNYKNFVRLSLCHPVNVLEDACTKLIQTVEELK